jgi:CO dehydrogenase maturation factor
MGLKIAVAGKGGTGKTTLSALIIRSLIEEKKKSVLALDADPNSNLNELLGVKVKSTVGHCVEDFKKNGAVISSGLYKDQMVEMNLHQSVVEGKGFDLLVMGRGEGPGCYCAANNLFKKYIDMLQDSYDYVVMDNEAGLEHLSRKTTNNVDIMLIISDPSARGILSASRINTLIDELTIKVKKTFLIINRLDGPPDKRLLKIVKDSGFDDLLTVDNDLKINNTELNGESIFALPRKSISFSQVKKILLKIL